MIADLPAPLQNDIWSDWLLHRRHASDPELTDFVSDTVNGYADRVLDGARLTEGMTLADIGTGDGLVAFRAIERVGPSLDVILTDISRPMLTHAEQAAQKRGFCSQCSFVECSADSLDGIASESVDVVTTRSVLAYVADKTKALREFHRILKPNGRISIAEPILQDDALFVRVLRNRVNTTSSVPTDRFLQLLHRWKSSQFPDTEEACANSPHTNYTERNLLRFVLESGFANVHLELHIDVKPSPITSWDVFITCTPHPWAPPLQYVLKEHFTAEERQFFEKMVRPGVESGDGTDTERIVFITAEKKVPAPRR